MLFDGYLILDHPIGRCCKIKITVDTVFTKDLYKLLLQFTTNVI